MKKNITIIIAVMALLITGTAAVFAAGTPGSDSDPIVSKSYVDNAISQLKSSLGSTNSSSTFKVVQVAAGKHLMCGEGTQLILRSGEASAISITINGIVNGVSDLTAGTDLTGGQAVGTNHLLLAPRGDGRGITAKTDIYVMVCGTYSIE